ncbi:MAG: hypothetical protein ACREF7_01320, partial [Candidatus Saccharimonadales bacterium]
SSLTLGSTTNTTAGDTIVLVAGDGGGAYVTGATDTKGNTYYVDTYTNSQYTITVLHAYLATALVAGDTITVTTTSGVPETLIATEYSGIAQNSAVDVATSVHLSSTTTGTAEVETTDSSDILVAAVSVYGTQTLTTPAGYQLRTTSDADNSSAMADETPGVSNEEVSAAWNWTTSTNAAVALVAYEPGSGSVGGGGGGGGGGDGGYSITLTANTISPGSG